jgi:hypothetical protein
MTARPANQNRHQVELGMSFLQIYMAPEPVALCHPWACSLACYRIWRCVSCACQRYVLVELLLAIFTRNLGIPAVLFVPAVAWPALEIVALSFAAATLCPILPAAPCFPTTTATAFARPVSLAMPMCPPVLPTCH